MISNPTTSSTATSVTVSWTLNTLAHSGVSYGPTPALGSGTPFDVNATATPSYTLTGLQPNTTYTLVIFSFGNNLTVSKTITATTTAAASVTGVSVSCGASSVAMGGTTICTPTVAGTGSYSSGVTWTTSAGTITPTGVLTAPATGSSVTVTAISTQDTTKSASATIALSSVVSSVGVICPASVTAGATVTCTSSVAGLGNYSSAVTWKTSAGTITPAGVLTAPTTGSSVTVTATSTQDATKTAVATVAVNPVVAVTNVKVTCSAASAGPNATVTCTAAVIGTGNFSTAVKWTTTAGTISADGVLIMPASGTQAVVRAISVQSPMISGVKVVTLSLPLAIVQPTFSATSTTIVISWTVTQGAHNGVSWGTTPHYGSTTAYDNNLVTSPTYTFTGLEPNTTYCFLLFSFNANGSVSTPVTFTTTP